MARLQEIFFADGIVVFGFLKNAEDGANAHVDIDVARAIQRVKHQQVFALWITVGNQVDVFHFFGSHGRQMAAPFVGFDQNFIGNDVQFFLNFTLNIFNVGTAQNTTQCTFVDRMTDAFTSTCNHF